MNGILNLYKPSGITSHSAVAAVKRLFGAQKAGHCGTLDPMAAGVLPVMLGSAVKLSEYLVEHDLIVAELLHLLGDAVGDALFFAALAGDGDHITQEAGHIGAVGLCGFLDGFEIHGKTSVESNSIFCRSGSIFCYTVFIIA